MCARICSSQNELDDLLGKLKITACPHCKRVGALIRHGVLRGYEEGIVQHTTVRAQRVFCSNRNRASGCGRTFSVWIADKIKRLFLSADRLWSFLELAVSTGTRSTRFENSEAALAIRLRIGFGGDFKKPNPPSEPRSPLCVHRQRRILRITQRNRRKPPSLIFKVHSKGMP